MPRKRRIESVFLNIPYDAAFENLYLATLAVPNQGRLSTIIKLIEESDFSIHDLSRIEASSGLSQRNC